MKAMGLSRLVLVNPKLFPDAQADAMAAGATDLLVQAEVVESLAQALSGTVLAVAMTARRRELAVPALWARDAAAELIASAGSGEVALVFGNETSGLSNDELLACQRHATIPASTEYPSLNLAAAVQVACYELALAAGAFRVPDRPPRTRATGADLEALHARLQQLLVASGFLDPREPGRLDERMRRLAARLDLETEEVAILHGMLDSLARRKK
jgi:tRNA/rRNA methyltransferase